MITKEEFIKYLNEWKSFETSIDAIGICVFANEYSVWETKFADAAGKMLDIFINSHFTEEGSDLINWYLFESVQKTITIPETLFEPSKKISLESLDDLWDFLKSDSKIYFK